MWRGPPPTPLCSTCSSQVEDNSTRWVGYGLLILNPSLYKYYIVDIYIENA